MKSERSSGWRVGGEEKKSVKGTRRISRGPKTVGFLPRLRKPPGKTGFWGRLVPECSHDATEPDSSRGHVGGTGPDCPLPSHSPGLLVPSITCPCPAPIELGRQYCWVLSSATLGVQGVLLVCNGNKFGDRLSLSRSPGTTRISSMTSKIWLMEMSRSGAIPPQLLE